MAVFRPKMAIFLIYYINTQLHTIYNSIKYKNIYIIYGLGYHCECIFVNLRKLKMKFVNAYTDFTKKSPEIKLGFDLGGLLHEFLWLKHDPKYMLDPDTNLWFDGDINILNRIIKETDGKLKLENDNLHPSQQKRNLTMNNVGNGYFKQWHSLCGTMPDTLPGIQLNTKLAFSSSVINPEDYATFKLDYDIDMTGSCTIEIMIR